MVRVWKRISYVMSCRGKSISGVTVGLGLLCLCLVPSWKFYCKLSETCLKYNLIPQHVEFYRYGIEIITNFESVWLAKILIFFTSLSVTAR